jgi:hypothetical protein
MDGVFCRAHSPDPELQQSQARVPAVQLHRIPAGAAVMLSEPPAAALPANFSTCGVPSGKSTDREAICSSLFEHSSDVQPEAAATDRVSSCSCCSTEQPAVATHLPACESYASQFCWLKLLLPWLLPAEVEFVLYLDCDMLVIDNPCGLLQEASTAFKMSISCLDGSWQLPVAAHNLLCHHSAISTQSSRTKCAPLAPCCW